MGLQAKKVSDRSRTFYTETFRTMYNICNLSGTHWCFSTSKSKWSCSHIFFFTSLTGQIKLRKRGKLHILMSKNNILKPLGSFTTTFILVIISSPPGQFLSLLKKSLVLKGMEGWVWWRATESSIACTSIAIHYTELLLIQIVSFNVTVTIWTDTCYSYMENCSMLLPPEPASYTFSTVKGRIHCKLWCKTYTTQVV